MNNKTDTIIDSILDSTVGKCNNVSLQEFASETFPKLSFDELVLILNSDRIRKSVIAINAILFYLNNDTVDVAASTHYLNYGPFVSASLNNTYSVCTDIVQCGTGYSRAHESLKLFSMKQLASIMTALPKYTDVYNALIDYMITDAIMHGTKIEYFDGIIEYMARPHSSSVASLIEKLSNTCKRIIASIKCVERGDNVEKPQTVPVTTPRKMILMPHWKNDETTDHDTDLPITTMTKFAVQLRVDPIVAHQQLLVGLIGVEEINASIRCGRTAVTFLAGQTKETDEAYGIDSTKFILDLIARGANTDDTMFDSPKYVKFYKRSRHGVITLLIKTASCEYGFERLKTILNAHKKFQKQSISDVLNMIIQGQNIDSEYPAKIIALLRENKLIIDEMGFDAYKQIHEFDQQTDIDQCIKDKMIKLILD